MHAVVCDHKAALPCLRTLRLKQNNLKTEEKIGVHMVVATRGVGETILAPEV